MLLLVPVAAVPASARTEPPPPEHVFARATATNLRRAPAKDAPVAFQLPFGFECEVLEVRGEWYHVAPSGLDTEGWLHASVVAERRPAVDPAALAKAYAGLARSYAQLTSVVGRTPETLRMLRGMHEALEQRLFASEKVRARDLLALAAIQHTRSGEAYGARYRETPAAVFNRSRAYAPRGSRLSCEDVPRPARRRIRLPSPRPSFFRSRPTLVVAAPEASFRGHGLRSFSGREPWSAYPEKLLALAGRCGRIEWVRRAEGLTLTSPGAGFVEVDPGAGTATRRIGTLLFRDETTVADRKDRPGTYLVFADPDTAERIAEAGAPKVSHAVREVLGEDASAYAPVQTTEYDFDGDGVVDLVAALQLAVDAGYESELVYYYNVQGAWIGEVLESHFAQP